MPKPKYPSLYKVSAFSLAYAIFRAHRAGTPLSKIKQLLIAPSNSEGLTDFTLHEKTGPGGEHYCTVQMHTKTTIHSVDHGNTTHRPFGTNPGFLLIDFAGAAHSCFGSNSVVLIHRGKTLCTASVSLLISKDITLSSTQQRNLLAALIPDLPPTSPLLANMPAIRIGIRTSTTWPPRAEHSSINVALLLWSTEALNGPTFEAGELSSTEPNADGKYAPLPLPLTSLATFRLQTHLANLHAIHETLLLNPQWQLLRTEPRVTNQELVQPIDTSAPDLRQLFSFFEEAALNLSCMPLPDGFTVLPDSANYCGQYPYIPLAPYARILTPMPPLTPLSHSQLVALFCQSLTNLQMQVFAESLSCYTTHLHTDPHIPCHATQTNSSSSTTWRCPCLLGSPASTMGLKPPNSSSKKHWQTSRNQQSNTLFAVLNGPSSYNP